MSTEVEQLWLSLSTLQAAFDSAVRELRAVAIAAKETAEERDAARRELAALEWLLIHHPDELRALVMADGDKSGRYSYCARARGWEG